MAEKKHINEKREKQHRLALLTLAACEKEHAAVCPDSGELAEFLDGKCSAERRQELMAHVAHCESCYQEWLLVSRVIGEERKQSMRGRIVSFISKKSFLTAAGSACAVAASIMVFWVTPFYHGEKQFLHVPEPQVESASDSSFIEQETAGDSIDQKKSDYPVLREGVRKEMKMPAVNMADKTAGSMSVGMEQAPASVPASPAKISTDLGSQVIDENQALKMKHKEKGAVRKLENQLEEEVDAENVKRKVMQTTVTADSMKPREIIDDYHNFRQQIVVICNSGRNDLGEITKLRKQAQVLTESGIHFSAQQKENLEKALNLLDSSGEQADNKELCHQLMDILFSDDN